MKASKKLLVIALTLLCIVLLYSTTLVLSQKPEEFESKKAADLAKGLGYFQIAKNVNAKLTSEERDKLRAAIRPELDRGKALIGHDKELPNEAKIQKRETRDEIRAIDRRIKAKVEEILGKERVQQLQILKPREKVLKETHSSWWAYYSYLYAYWTYYYAYWTYIFYDTYYAYCTYVNAYYSYIYAYYAYLYT